MDTAARDQAQRSKGYSCSNMGDGPEAELTLDYDEWLARPISSRETLTFPEALIYAQKSEANEGIFAYKVGPIDQEAHTTPDDGACTVLSCSQGEDTKANGEPRPLREYGSASPSGEGRAHSIEFIDRAIEGLRRERAESGSGQSLTEGRLATIRKHYEPPGSNVPSNHWLEDEDVEAIHRVLGTPVAI
jgi:hypothetical protein